MKKELDVSEHLATISWQRHGSDFVDDRYSRVHAWSFDGGVEVVASSSPHVVPVPMSAADAVDPEEAFVACLASCHMLWFLSIARKRGYIVDAYTDHARGIMDSNAEGRMAITVVTLHPQVTFGGLKRADPEQLRDLHHAAHTSCFIANSVKTDVRCEPLMPSSH